MFDNDFVGVDDNGTWKLTAGIARGTDEGKLVKVSAEKTVDLCSAEDIFLGKLITIEKGDEYGVVQEKGYQTISYSGTAPTPGNNVELVADANGGVKIPAAADTGRFYVVASVDTVNGVLVMRLG